MVNGLSRFEDMIFAPDGHILDFGIAKDSLAQAIDSGNPFLTPGCPDCNRPFYNEKPSGPIYNYPRKLTTQEIAAIKHQLEPQLSYA
jgi:biotin synthase